MVKNKLGNFVKIRTGKLDANASSIDGEYPFFTCSKEPLKISSFSYDCKCVLVAGNGDLNVKYYEGKFDAYQRTYIIESKDESILDTRYLYWFLFKYVEKLRELSIGGVIKYIKINNLTDPIIPLPPIEDQIRIVKILDETDALCQKRKQAIGLLDYYLKSVFLEMFGDPVKNEKGWEVIKLGSMIDFMTSGSRGWAKYYSEKGDVFLRIQNVRNNSLKLDDLCFITPPNTAEAKRTKVRGGDVLLSITADLGRTAVIPENFGDAYISQHLALLRLKKEFIPDYIAEFLTSRGGMRQMNRLNKGGVKAGLNFNDIKSLQIPIPNIETQQVYLNKKIQVLGIKNKMLTQSAGLETQFQSLMQKAFKGEL